MILGVLFLLIFGMPLLNNLREGAEDLYRCPGDCLEQCPEGWRHERYADGDCRADDENTLCCVEVLIAGNQPIVSTRELTFLFNGEEVPNGGTATLVPRGVKDKSEYAMEGTLSLKIEGDLRDKGCYWKVGDGSWEEHLGKTELSSGSKPFSTLVNKYLAFSAGSSTPYDYQATNLVPCSRFAVTEKLSLGGENTDILTQLYGERIKLDLVLVDKDCTGDYTLCKAHTQTLFLQIPEQKGTIRLHRGSSTRGEVMSEQAVALLPRGETHEFTLHIDGPLPYCSIDYRIPLTDAAGQPLFDTEHTEHEPAFLAELSAIKASYSEQKSCTAIEREEHFALPISDTTVGGTPFELTILTATGEDPKKEGYKARTSTYRFLVAPDRQLRILGPSPGLEREKTLTLTCDDLACDGTFEIAYLDNPLDCTAERTLPGDFSTLEDLSIYGGENSGVWRAQLRSEEHNGKYACIKASTNKGAHYSVGLWNDLPTRITIDRTKPTLNLDWHGFEGYLEMHCEDNEGTDENPYVSGCPEKPFSYAYITDPFLFVANVGTGGLLDDDWAGCPDPETGNWAKINREDNQWPYLSSEIRVICIKAEDGAGNWATDSRILFSSQEALALLLREVATEVAA
jgi:hypothetical protein